MKDFDEAWLKYNGGVEKAREIAKKMRDMGEPMEKIRSYTNLSEKEIREL